ncbi:hypothetical protein PASE110613_17630 [Paenibacillus sediminis]|uniref:Magnesium-transporting ATPase (P-type) n=1 Tax=Paenibacillus sediminis TaxID=664909 RepID=A0ABS4H404_9BACL|nr:hypothetical protein [Paenibacillus sediminis]MBP1937265.1 magnesium-transporting ATPase (P-type) [Paenibacillus sediminis]
MISVFKHVKPFFLIILLGSILASYSYLKSIGISDLTTMYQTIFGGKPLNGVLLKSLFVMIFSLLQYTLIDYIVFYIDNSDNLSIRYGNKNDWLKALLKGALIITAAFVILFYLIGLLFNIVSGNFDVFQTINMNTVGVIARVYLFCTIAVFAQIYLLLKFTKTSTFMIMGGISIFLAMTNHYQALAFYILPRSSSPMITLLNVVESIVLAIALIALIQRRILKKELSSYEN